MRRRSSSTPSRSVAASTLSTVAQTNESFGLRLSAHTFSAAAAFSTAAHATAPSSTQHSAPSASARAAPLGPFLSAPLTAAMHGSTSFGSAAGARTPPPPPPRPP